MPICKKCNKPFPYKIEIDGKKRSLTKRKYCLECSPFGVHNTKPLHLREPDPHPNLVCVVCGREYQYKKYKGHSKSFCNSCRTTNKKFVVKSKMVEYKGGKCSRCGYDKNIKALQFHHIDESLKSFELSCAYTRAQKTVLLELDKCELVCANCHAELHDALLDTPYFKSPLA